MKFNCGETWKEKRARLSEWHVWYAWHPVWIASRECLWLERVERKGRRQLIANSDGMPEEVWDWEYRV